MAVTFIRALRGAATMEYKSEHMILESGDLDI
jgi:hypothetical protein